MNRNKLFFLVCLLGVAALLGSCGKSNDKTSEEKGESTLERIARLAASEASTEGEVEALTAKLNAAGYEIVSYDNFASQEVGKKGRMLIYADKGHKSGGVVYIKKIGADFHPAWHWYFSGAVPETVDRVELNDDGLWDVEVRMKGGNKMDYVQDGSFSMTAREREDWIAMNGASSPAADDQHALWLCFDGDTTTAWKGTLGSGDAFVELPVPFGVEEGILTVQTLDSEQPAQCTVFADGKKIEDFTLEPKAGRQMVRLNDSVKGAKRVRLVFDTAQDHGTVVSIAELALK